jgi:hypothetical protein
MSTANANSAMLSAKLVNNAQLKVYRGTHTTCAAHKNQINADLLAFIKS